MFQSYFKTAWRTILKSKGYSLINITGLAMGMAVALLIGLWVYNEYSYDRWLPGYEQAYQVKVNFTGEQGTRTQDAVSLPLVDVLRKDVPGIRVVAESDWMGSHDLMVGDKKLYSTGAMIGEGFLSIFRFPLLKGNAASVLKDPFSIVLTQSTAVALFGDQDPMNKLVKLDNYHDLKVTGILRDLPKNTSFDFNYLIPYSYNDATEPWYKQARTSWTNNSFQIFVALEPSADVARVSARVKKLIWDHSVPMRVANPEVLLHPLKDWRLRSGFKDGKAAGGFIDYVRLFSIIGGLVLLIACINFMNLSTARSEKRAKEVGVRKTMGASRRDLVARFLSESVLTAILAFFLAIGLVQLVLPAFNGLIKSSVHIPFESGVFWVIMLEYVLATGLLAGSRPAWYLSSFNPVRVLKGVIQNGRSASLSRKMLVTLQFSCSIALIISTIIVYQQIQYTKNRPTGYSRERLMMTDMSGDLNNNYTALRNSLLKSGIVESVSAASSPATNIYFHTGVNNWPGRPADEPRLNIGAISVAGDYFNTLGMELSGGRDFKGSYQMDSATIILNEAAVRRMHLQQPIGARITWNDNETAEVVGVVKDAVMESPFSPVMPLIFYPGRGFSTVFYRVNPQVKTHDAIAALAGIFGQYNPAYPYIYHFVDEEYARKFDLEVLVGKLAGIFAGLAIFISCLGLFGLASFMAEQRGKEIGIRKVLGASVPQLWMLLSKDFLLLVGISCVIASPVAWYYLQHWLQGYEYRIHIGPVVFILAAVAAVLITLVTVSFQAIKAALANPSQRLRTE